MFQLLTMHCLTCNTPTRLLPFWQASRCHLECLESWPTHKDFRAIWPPAQNMTGGVLCKNPVSSFLWTFEIHGFCTKLLNFLYRLPGAGKIATFKLPGDDMNPLKFVSVNSSTKPKEPQNLPITYGFSDDMATCTKYDRWK